MSDVGRMVATEVGGIGQPSPDEGGGRGDVVPATLGTRINLAVCLVVTGVSLFLLIFADLPPEPAGLTCLGLLLGLLFLGVPIAAAMLGSSIVGLWALGGIGVVEASLSQMIYRSAASWQLSVVPLFVLMGIALWRSGATNSAFECCRAWFGRLPGGLAISSNFAGAGMAAASGSSIGICYAVGRIAIPEMLKRGYAPSLATGTVAMAGALGQLIPPSTVLVIYAGVAQVPVGPQLLAAVIPGVMIAVAFALVILLQALLKPSIAPRELTAASWGERFRSLPGLMPIVFTMTIVIGGLFLGVFTPTEAGAFAAGTTLVMGCWFVARRKSGGMRQSISASGSFIYRTLMDTATASATIFLLIIGVEILGRTMALSGVSTLVADAATGLDLNRVTFLLLLIVIYIILGLAFEPVALVLLTVPVLMESLIAFDINPIWFGVFLVVMCEVANVSPPIGLLIFVVHAMAQDREVSLGQRITLNDVYRGVIWFVVAALALLLLFILVPEIVMYLPDKSIS